jgi:ParB family transcriptional regulator, chromosome partitioning protein
MICFRISEIWVGERHRRDLGDIDALAASIDEIGLLHPVVVRRDGELVAGERRYEACKRLGWNEVPVTIVDLDEITRAELDENFVRKDFLPSEIDSIRRAIEPVEKAAAKVRMSDGGKGAKSFATFKDHRQDRDLRRCLGAYS